MSELFYAPDCARDCDICDHADPYTFFDPEFDPDTPPELFKQAAHTLTLERLKKLAEQSRSTVKGVKEAAKRLWAGAKDKVKAKLAEQARAQAEDDMFLETYRRFSPPNDRLLG
jgi:hypothetical protein